MAISFPASPTTNQTFSYNNVTWVYDGNKWRKGSTVYSGGGATVSVSATAPDTTTQGSLWFDVDQGDLAVYSGTGWLNIGQGSGDPGYTGSIGPSGGYTGSAGAGYTGSAGIGYTGSASTVAGYTGSAGAGYTGSAGTTGSAGYTGSAGAGSSTPAAVSSQSNTATDFFGIPRGTTAQRPSVPDYGALRYNSTTGYAEVYTSGGWTVMGLSPPTITSVTPATYNGESGTVFTINGTGFTVDATVKFIDVNNTEFTAVNVTFINITQITAATPQDFTVAQEPLDVRVAQLSGSATKLDCIDTGGSPSWTTAAGQIGGNIYKTNAVSTSVAATDPDSGATVTYSIVSGALPSGLTLNTSTGAITGTAPVVASDTTYNFTIRVTDNAGNTADRAFSMVILVGIPGAPTIGTATRASATSVQVAFTAPGNIGGSAITSYTATSSPGAITGTGASSPVTVSGLTTGTAYTFTVTATNSYGTSAASAASNSVTPLGVPGAPTIGTASSTGTSTATVSFTAPASNGGATITSYTAVSSPGGITGTLSQAGSGTISITGLTSGTAYTFTVYATNSVGNSANSSASNSTTTFPVLGASFGGGYFAGAYSSTGNGVATHFLVISPKSTGEPDSAAALHPPNGVSFRTSQSAITTTTYDGYANQQAMIAADSSLNSFPAAKFCKNLSIGGYTDWYLPSVLEMEILYWNLKPTSNGDRTLGPNDVAQGYNGYAVPSRASVSWNTGSGPNQTSVGIFQDGQSQAFTTSGSVNGNAPFYWTSSSYSSTQAWWLTPRNGYGSGGWGYYYETMNYGSAGDGRAGLTCRAIRKVAI